MSDPGPAVVLFEAPGKNFQRVLTESTLDELHTNLRSKLCLGGNDALDLVQVWDGKEVDLVDDADFAAFTLRSRRVGFATIKLTCAVAYPPSLPPATKSLQESQQNLSSGQLQSTTSTTKAKEQEVDLPSNTVEKVYTEDRSRVKGEKSKKKMKKRSKQEVVDSITEQQGPSNNGMRVPTPDILKDHPPETHTTVVPLEKRLKKRKHSPTNLKGNKMGTQDDTRKKQSKRSKTSADESSLAPKSQNRDGAGASGAVSRVLGKSCDLEATKSHFGQDSSFGTREFRSVELISGKQFGREREAPSELTSLPRRKVKGQWKQQNDSANESMSPERNGVSISLYNDKTAVSSPPWVAERLEGSMPIRDSFSDQINESQYLLSPSMGTVRERSAFGDRVSDSNSPSDSKASQACEETRLRMHSSSFYHINRSQSRSPTFLGEELPAILNARTRMAATTTTELDINAQDKIPPLQQALSRGETDSIVGTGDVAIQDILNQDNRILQIRKSKSPVIVSSNIIPNTFDGSAIEFDGLNASFGMYSHVERDVSSTSCTENPEGSKVDQHSKTDLLDDGGSSSLYDGGFQPNSSIIRSIGMKDSKLKAIKTIPSARPSYPSLSSILMLPSQPKTRSIPAPIDNNAHMEEDTSSDGSADSEGIAQGQIPEDRRAGASLSRPRGLFDYFKLR